MKPHIVRKSRLHRFVVHDIFSNSAVSGSDFWGIVSEKPSFLYERHISSLLRVLKYHYRRKSEGSFGINVFLNSFLTSKSVGVRMGKGKGSVSERVMFMRPGFLVLFINDSNFARARYIINKCKRRLPVSCKSVSYNSW